uniref:Uncharacterized protein n=1 Tax=Brassica campestris TaxID=3711 RepID=M4EE54_BRACM
MASSRFEDSNYAKKLFRLSSLFYGARRRLSFFLTRVDNDSRGGIQLSDYRMGALIDTVDNHEGPTKSLKCSNFSFRTTTVRLSAFDVQASQLHQNLFRVRVELTVIVSTRISPKFVGDGQKLKETDIAIGSGEIPVNPTPLLNETTTAAQTTLMKA